MNQRGFFTVIGLCFLLAVTFCVKFVQESQKNYATDAAAFRDELELQNCADSALLRAAESFRANNDIITEYADNDALHQNHQSRQQLLFRDTKNSERLGNISVEVYGERGTIQTEPDANSTAKDAAGSAKGAIFICVASCTVNKQKKYRRSLAYVKISAPGKIYYLNTL